MDDYNIYHQDCIQGLRNIPDESVDIVLADPPYNIGKDFGNNSDKQNAQEYLKWCDEWIQECIRILKPNGTFYIFGFSETLAYIRVRLPNIKVRWLVWHYENNFTRPTLHFWQRSHESILCCFKNKPTFNRDEVRVPYSKKYFDKYKNRHNVPRKCDNGGRFKHLNTMESTYKLHPNGALPRDVIKIPSLSGGASVKEKVNHPTQKPIALCRYLLRACRFPKDNVRTRLVVPFAGSGSECVAAILEDIDYSAYEINEDYVKLSRQRCASATSSN